MLLDFSVFVLEELYLVSMQLQKVSTLIVLRAKKRDLHGYGLGSSHRALGVDR